MPSNTSTNLWKPPSTLENFPTTSVAEDDNIVAVDTFLPYLFSKYRSGFSGNYIPVNFIVKSAAFSMI